MPVAFRGANLVRLIEKLEAAISAGLDIRESFVTCEGRELFRLANSVARPGMKIAEIGSWKGFSTYFLASLAARLNGTVFAVDHWQGSPDGWQVPVAKEKDILMVFRRNMAVLGCEKTVKPMVMDSLTAAGIFRDGSLDLVFIDGDHRYSGIAADIKAWLPKLRTGGILCGHDGSTSYSRHPAAAQRSIDANCEKDYLPEYQVHPGVTKALHDLLGDQQSLAGSTCIWYWRKTVGGMLTVNTGLRRLAALSARLEYGLLVVGGNLRRRIERRAS